MNLNDLIYSMAALGAGAGLALAVGAQYGFFPAALAFVGGIAVVFVLTALVINLAGGCCRASKRRHGSEKREDSEHDGEHEPK